MSRFTAVLLVALIAVSAASARKIAPAPTAAIKKAKTAYAPAVAKKAKAVPFAAAPAAVLKKTQPTAVSPEADVQVGVGTGRGV